MDQLKKKIQRKWYCSTDTVTVCCGARERENGITEQLRKSMTCIVAALSISHQFSLLLRSTKSCKLCDAS